MSVNFLKNALKVKINDRVAIIELEKPNVLHGIENDMIKELIQKLKEISFSDDIQIVILTEKKRPFIVNSINIF